MGCGSSNNEIDSSGILSKPQVFFLLGGPGSGKGTQAENLVKDYRFKHLSTGDLLRKELKNGGIYAEDVKSCMNDGKLVTSELVVKLLKKSISANGNRRYLIDGFPRNHENMDEFNKQLKKFVVMKDMIYFECSHEIMTERIMQRAKSSGREDDTPETILKRLGTFEKQTIPIIKQFENQGNFFKINAHQKKEQVYAELKSKLTMRKIQPPPIAQMIFVLGGPGSGKGTQCTLLVKKYGFLHLSTGDLLREAIKRGSPLGKEIDGCIKEGKLVSDELMVGLIEEKMESYNYGGRYLLDGFPRGEGNIIVWKKMMADRVKLNSVLFFDCDEQELTKRLLNRGKTSGRTDDNHETIKKRLNTFNEQTKPIVQLYSKEGKLYRIDAKDTIENIFEKLEQHMDSLGIFPKQLSKDRAKGVMVLGTPGSGKGTQCSLIAKQFGFIHISTGQLLRRQMNQVGPHAELIAESMKMGRLVPSKLVVGLLREQLNKHDWKGVFLLDGFPRNKENIQRWNQEIGSELDLSYVLHMECTMDNMKERLMGRQKTGKRNDDNPESISKRLETFNKETLPIIQKFSRQQNFVIKVNADRSIEEIFAQIKKYIIGLSSN